MALLILFSPTVCFADNKSEELEAIEAIKYASYKQLGIEAYFTEYTRNMVPDEYKPYIEYIAPIVETIKRQRLELKWEF